VDEKSLSPPSIGLFPVLSFKQLPFLMQITLESRLEAQMLRTTLKPGTGDNLWRFASRSPTGCNDELDDHCKLLV